MKYKIFYFIIFIYILPIETSEPRKPFLTHCKQIGTIVSTDNNGEITICWNESLKCGYLTTRTAPNSITDHIRLIRYAIAELQKKHVSAIYTTTNLQNTEIIKAYEQLGFIKQNQTEEEWQANTISLKYVATRS